MSSESFIWSLNHKKLQLRHESFRNHLFWSPLALKFWHDTLKFFFVVANAS